MMKNKSWAERSLTLSFFIAFRYTLPPSNQNWQEPPLRFPWAWLQPPTGVFQVIPTGVFVVPALHLLEYVAVM
jgi:hypothetical protein